MLYVYSLGELKKLKLLVLSSNDFSTGKLEVIGKVTALEELWLSNCELTKLPTRCDHFYCRNA